MTPSICYNQDNIQIEGVFLELFTVEKNFYAGYICFVSVTNNLECLYCKSAKEYYKIIHIAFGTLHVTINGQKCILVGTHVIFLNELDDFVCDEVQDNQVTILFFKPSFINSKFDFEICNFSDSLSVSENQDLAFLAIFKHKTELSSKTLAISIIESSILLQKLQQINYKLTSQESSFWPCQTRATLLEILFLLTYREKNTDGMSPIILLNSYSKLTIEIINYLQIYYNKKITIESLAQFFCTNRTTLISDFKKSTGISVNKYLTQLRMKIASTHLRNTELSISEICERTGFSDISYFSKAFKNETKCTPTEYRNRCSDMI